MGGGGGGGGGSDRGWTTPEKSQKYKRCFMVYLNKFENAVTHLFLVILGNN